MNMTIDEKHFFRILDKELPGGGIDKCEYGSRIYFEKLPLSDLNDMHEYSSKDKFYKYLQVKKSNTILDTEKYLKNLLNEMGSDPMRRMRMAWSLKRVDNSKMIGTATLLNISHKNQSVEWSYGIDPDLWGKGYVFEVQNVLKKYVFEVLKINRLYGGAIIDNKLTISTLLKSGMLEEGIKRRAIRGDDGNYHDIWCYSMLEDEYFSINKPKVAFTEKKYELNKVNKIVTYVLGSEEYSNNLYSSPDWDSLSQMNIVSSLEKEYQVSFTFDDILNMTSVDAIKKILNNKQR